MSDSTDRLLSWPQVRSLVGDLARMTVWRMEKRGEFPARVQITQRRVAWREGDVLSWIATRQRAT